MSDAFRNPFKLRNSEKIDSEIGFLRLFSPLALEALVQKHRSGTLWENVLLIHSSPGGGKTSLLRAFEPGSLTTLWNSKSASDYRDLFNTLKGIDAISKSEVKLLGVSLPCTRNYQILEELNISEAQKKRLFFSLLNSRVILSTLRAACRLKNRKFPEGLEDIEFRYDNSDNYFKSLEVPCNGKQLFDWASNIEKDIYKTIDSFIPETEISVEGHDELISLLVLNPQNLYFRGKPLCSRILFMFDDAHKLSDSQRLLFKQYIFEKRSGANIWISERLEALAPDEQLKSFEGRDFEELNLENYWNKNQKKLKEVLRNISDKRAALSSEEVTSFQEYLIANLSETDANEKLSLAVKETTDKIHELSKVTNKFDEWIGALDDLENETLLNRAIRLKEIEILIHRNLGKNQLSFDFPMPIEELDKKTGSEVTKAAALFLSSVHDMPYYFGFEDLVKLSSFNIEQFLSFSSEMFEAMISNKIKGDQIILSDREQHDIIVKVAKHNWKKLRTEIPFGQSIRRFLTGLGEFSKTQTFKPNAPYAPGVNGFAITPSVQDKLYPEEQWINNSIYQPLVNVVSTCVAYNLLERHTLLQGKKGQSHTVYYMNRWLCVFFGLPLSYGGWRHQTPDQLIKWIKK
ncbi:hypothetical protein AB1A65_16065 [Muricauda sp. ANG21]|uniref:ORC-CDC6 family AAA ATPase n=1 Tax=Allomuricauda sp. ANG21 TaxID=3042468 RepID=UPI003451731E